MPGVFQNRIHKQSCLLLFDWKEGICLLIQSIDLKYFCLIAVEDKKKKPLPEPKRQDAEFLFPVILFL